MESNPNLRLIKSTISVVLTAILMSTLAMGSSLALADSTTETRAAEESSKGTNAEVVKSVAGNSSNAG